MMMRKHNRVNLCAHCGKFGKPLCDACKVSGHVGASMFGCEQCVRSWHRIDQQIAQVCDRGPSVAKLTPSVQTDI